MGKCEKCKTVWEAGWINTQIAAGVYGAIGGAGIAAGIGGALYCMAGFLAGGHIVLRMVIVFAVGNALVLLIWIPFCRRVLLPLVFRLLVKFKSEAVP